MTPPSWLWVIFTLIGATGQSMRNAAQKGLTARLGTAARAHLQPLGDGGRAQEARSVENDAAHRLAGQQQEAAGGRDRATVDAALVLLWASQHLENLWLLEAHLANRANDAQRSTATGEALGKLRILAS